VSSNSASASSAPCVYVALDGDDVGRRVEELIATADEEAVRRFAGAVRDRLQTLADLTRQRGGRLIFCAGDSLLAWMQGEAARELCRYATDPHEGIVLSGGIGPGMIEAMLALHLAKARGRGCYVVWEDVGKTQRGRIVKSKVKKRRGKM
jgi:minimal CRISPR polymerase domain